MFIYTSPIICSGIPVPWFSRREPIWAGSEQNLKITLPYVRKNIVLLNVYGV